MNIANIKLKENCNQTVAEIFEMQVQKTPEAVAIHNDSIKYTYNELNEKSKRIDNIELKK